MTTSDLTAAAVAASATPPGPDDPGSATASPPQRRRRKLLLLAILGLLGLLGLLLILVAGWYVSTGKPLTQLPGLATTKVPHYEFSIYGVTRPLGVAVNASGDRVYVTQSDGPRLVRVYNRAGKAIGTLKPPASQGAMHTPVYVAVDPRTQDVYVSDRPSAAVYVYNDKGTFLHAFKPKGDLGGGWAPLGLAFAPDGTFYVTDVSGKAHRVLVFSPDGTLLLTLGKPGLLLFPNGVVVDRHGNIEVADSNNGRLVVFDPRGKLLATISRGLGEGDLGLPRGVAVDDSNRLFVVDTSDHMVRVYRLGDATSPMPAYLGSFGTEGQLEGTFEYPNGAATDRRGRIYVTDRENNRVQVWSY